MNWKTILKIKDPEGRPLRMRDYYQFIALLKATLRSKVAAEHPTRTGEGASGRSKEISRININRIQGETDDRILRFKISGLNAGSGDRYSYEFTMWEDDEGDYVYRMVIGPGINFGIDTVVNDEQAIIDEIARMIGEEHSVTRTHTGAAQVQEEMIAEHDDHELYIEEFKDMEQRKVDYASEQGDNSLNPDYSKSWTERYNEYLTTIGRDDLVKDENE